MQIVKSLSNHKMMFYEDSDCISSMYFTHSYFIWGFDGDRKELNPMVVTEDHTVFYDNLKWLMDQNYAFSEESGLNSSKTKDRLEFMSDQISPMGNIDSTPRLVIIRRDQAFEVFYRVPSEEEDYGFPIRERRVAFGPAHNGQAADNVVTGDSLQDDVIRVFNYTLRNERITSDQSFMSDYNKLKAELTKKGKTLGKNHEL